LEEFWERSVGATLSRNNLFYFYSSAEQGEEKERRAHFPPPRAVEFLTIGFV
jgi:hypothetical protein